MKILLIYQFYHKIWKNIKVNGVSCKYPNAERNVFTNLSFEARKGDISLVKGPNGSGKSKLLNILCGEIKENCSNILFDNIERPPHECVTIVRQRPYIFNLDICTNIILSEAYDEHRYKTILNELKFDDYFDKDLISGKIIIQENGNSLSGGQIKIIALARCLYRKRSILILNEIFSNLDANMKKLIISFLKKYCQQHITVLVEHTDDFDLLANRFLNMNDYKEP